MWLEQTIERKVLPSDADQFNSLHDRLILGLKAIGKGRRLHLTAMMDSQEDAGNIAYLEDCARQAGLPTKILPIEKIGRAKNGGFVDGDTQPIELLFKLYPWEWMMHEAFGVFLKGATTQFIEPPWKAILSNKGLLPLLWQMFPNHPNLLPACFDDDPAAGELGTSYVRKPLYSREGANVERVVDGQALEKGEGPCGAEGYIRQALTRLPECVGNYAVIGSWMAAGAPCGLSIREETNPITRNPSRFVPHAIVG